MPPTEAAAVVPAASLKLRLCALALALAALLALGAAWTWSPLRAWLDIDHIVGALQRLGASFGMLATIAGFALAVASAVPLTFLTLVAIVAYGPWSGFACALPGALAGAALSYGIGVALGREAVEKLGGPRVNQVSRRLASRGVLAIVLVRLVPVAPFAIVNMVAGATRIRLHELLLGTAIGMTPGTLFIMLFMDRIIASLRQPDSFGLGLLALTVALLAAGGWALKRWLR